MKYDDFSLLVDKIAAFSGEAVVCLSLWGEAILHPQLDLFIEKILSYSGLSVLIELSGRKFSESMIERIKEAAKNGDSVGGILESVVSGMPCTS